MLKTHRGYMSIGVDIEDINRFEDKDQKFLDRLFTQKEQEYCLSKPNPASHFAVRFCAKEAVIKALNSSGVKHPQQNKIEVVHDINGCPKILIHDEKFQDINFEVSLSHDKSKAIAFVVIRGLED